MKKKNRGIIRRFINMKGKVFLYYNRITIGLQSGYNQLHHLLHLEKHTVQTVPSKKKKQKKEAKDKGERQNEEKRKKGKR